MIVRLGITGAFGGGMEIMISMTTAANAATQACTKPD
jgi:hypothetical protein